MREKLWKGKKTERKDLETSKYYTPAENDFKYCSQKDSVL